MNKCRYCKKELNKSECGWEVCKCNHAQKEWTIQMNIQQIQKDLSEAKKTLSELRESSKENLK